MKFEHYKLGNPHPKFKIVYDGEAMAVSVGKYYFRISVDIPKRIKRIVANHYFYKWVKTRDGYDLNLYLIWSE